MDLTQVPGIQSGTALVLMAELGPDFAERFPTAKHFGSWLGLCPDNRITGGKIMSSSTRDVKSRAATALRLAAQSLNKLWRPLPALEGAPGHPEGHHGDGAQTGAYPLAPLQISPAI
jgi:transposase